MWNRRWISPPGNVPVLVALVVPTLLAACGKTGPAQSSHRSVPNKYVAGSFIVSTQSTAGNADVVKLSNDVAAKLGCKAKPPVRVSWSAEQGVGVVSTALKNTYNLAFDGCDFGQDGTRKIVESLAGSADVRSAQAEAVADVQPIDENDPNKDAQGHLPAIHRDDACRLADKGGPPVIVAIIDTGIDLTHPDLVNMLLRDDQGQVIGANFVGSGANMPSDANFADQNGHGTHVAGLVGAQANNGQGGVGVAACANVKLMPVRVLNAKGSGTSLEIDRGIEWAVQHGAQVINLSLGYLTTVDATDSSAFYSAVIADAANNNVMVFAAAGNDGATMGADDGGGKSYDFPAAYDHVVAVAATDDQGQLTSFSNRGDRVKIATPGYQDLSTLRGGGYGRMSGTSMASPVAAGAYALALATARLGLPVGTDRVDVTTAQAMALKATVDGLSFATSDVASGGLLDAGKLAQAMVTKFPKHAASTPTPTPTPTPSQPDQPTQPVTPVPATPAAFGFTDLTDGAQPAFPQTLSVQNLPNGTFAVYFYWGHSPWSFATVYLDNGGTTAVSPDQWYLYGTRTLRAVALDIDGNQLATVAVKLTGY